MPLAKQTFQLLAARRFTKALHGDDEVEGVVLAGEAILDELRTRLSPLIGSLGFHALLNRTLMTVRPAHPWLATARVDSAGRLCELPAAVQGLGAVEVLSGFHALISHLLTLLNSLIGDDLTRWVISQTWPDEVLESTHPGMPEKQS